MFSRMWIMKHRIQNRWWDTRAVMKGYCNHCPWSPDHTRGGGYSFWRCALSRGHKGVHRARNYVWDGEGNTEYIPLDYSSFQQPWRRKPTLYRRQMRELKKFDSSHAEKLKYMRRAKVRRIKKGFTWLFYDNLGILIATAVLVWMMYALAFCTVPLHK